ncbi:MAG: FecR domain-containing protein [Acidobacteria bacterium]|nr:FecR domain-containing protein [Acidobacteriota bacterium]
MRANIRQLAVVLAVLSVALVQAMAQNAISARSGMVHYVEGDVALADKAVESKFGQFPEVKENQVLRTGEGRAEILLSPGAFLRMDENAAVRMITNRLIDTRVAVERGTVMVEVLELLKDNHVSLVAKDSTVSLRKNGLYRIDAGAGTVRVYEGEAVVERGQDRLTLKSARETSLGGVLMAQKFNNKLGDSLYRWGKRRSEYVAMANLSGSRMVRDRGGWSSSGWYWNPYFGMFTYVPYRGVLYSPYGYSFWSPRDVMRVYEPRRTDSAMAGGGGGSGYNSALGYNTASRSSGAYSAPAASSSPGSAPAAAASPRAADSATPRGGDSGSRGR